MTDLRRTLTMILMLAAMTAAWGRADADSDTDQADVRENPELEGDVGGTSEAHTSDYSRYPFIRADINRIDLNGSDWSSLARRFEASGDSGRTVSIVHIGDSHIQADGATGRTRRLLQQHYGDAGRGLVIPFRLAGTNQPVDYSISGPSGLTAAKLLRMPWPAEMGFTGIALQSPSANADYSITLRPDHGHVYTADRLTVFFSGAPAKVTALTAQGENIGFTVAESAPDHLTLHLDRHVGSLSVALRGGDDTAIHGFSLTDSRGGLAYHAIGNNGATYSSYNSVATVGRDITPLHPDLIIVSLGANEAFGRISSDAFYTHIHNMVSDLRRHNPGAEIMLVTPSECQRRVTTRRRRKGRRSRRVTSYQVNANIPRLGEVIKRYGRDHHVAVYDWYAVSGGAGSSSKWISSKLMSRDRIHNTWSGYSLQGDLLYDALTSTLKRQLNDH